MRCEWGGAAGGGLRGCPHPLEPHWVLLRGERGEHRVRGPVPPRGSRSAPQHRALTPSLSLCGGRRKRMAESELSRSVNEFLSRLQDDLKEAMNTMMCSKCQGKHK